MGKTIIWKGFSTRDYYKSGAHFQKNDLAIIKEGILNFIFTLRGERLYDPDYGTDIPTMALVRKVLVLAKVQADFLLD
jgi:hypothetical protein